MRTPIRTGALVFAVLLLACAASGEAETLYFVYQTIPTVDQNWLSAGNWYTLDGGGNPTVPANRVPGSEDTAVLRYAAKLTKGSSVAVQVLDVYQGGRLVGGGSIAAADVNMQSGQTAASLGEVTVSVASELNVTGPQNRLDRTSLTIEQGATAKIAANGVLQCAGGTTIVNSGRFILNDHASLDAGQDFVGGQGGTFTFHNAANPSGKAGTLISDGTTFVININNTLLVIDNEGVIRADSGTLTFRGLLKSGSQFKTGQLVTTSSKARIFSGADIDSGANILVTGPGTTYMPGSSGVTSFQIKGSLRVGASAYGNYGNLVIDGQFTTAGDEIVIGDSEHALSKLTLALGARMSAGYISVLDLATLELDGAVLDGGVISNDGSAFSRGFEMNAPAFFHNSVKGVLEIDEDQVISVKSGMPGIANHGTLFKAAGAGTTFVAPHVSNHGTVTVRAGTLELDNGYVQYSGATELTGGDIVAPGGFDIVGGLVEGSGTITANVGHYGGTFAPGESPGKLTIAGNYTQGVNGTLNIDLGGINAGTGFDQLAVSGKATLGGTLNISLMNGFYPAAGDSFGIVTCSSETGSFSHFNAPGNASPQIGAKGVTFVSPLIATTLPVITSSTTLAGALGQPFTYNVTATQNPANFSAAGLPAGLAIDKTSGAITGTPTVAGTFTVLLSAANASGIGTAFLSLTLANTSASNPLLNISTRLQVGTGNDVLIAGFIVTGFDRKKVLIRAIGPSLKVNGSPVVGRLADPVLELHGAHGAIIARNDNWKTTEKGGVITSDEVGDIQASGVAPTDQLESTIIATLDPGEYSAVIRGVNAATGIALAEVYDLSQSAAANLANISTRGFVDINDNVMIGGFIIGNHLATILLRGIGPSLGSSGITNFLADPAVELHDASGALIAFNDNWRSSQEAEIITTTIPPSDDREPALLVTLQPGKYTAVLRGVNNTTGVGLVEVYSLH